MSDHIETEKDREIARLLDESEQLRTRIMLLDELLRNSTEIIERAFEAAGVSGEPDIPLDEEVRNMHCEIMERRATIEKIRAVLDARSYDSTVRAAQRVADELDDLRAAVGLPGRIAARFAAAHPKWHRLFEALKLRYPKDRAP